MMFYVSKDSGKSSIYKPNFELLENYPYVERFKVINEVKLESNKVDKLDDVILKNNISDVDFLKLDTQGSEYFILQGSEKILKNLALGLKVEVEFIEMYKNQPLFSDIDIYMRKLGFELIDLRRAYWKRKDYTDFRGKGQLIFGDALYFRNQNNFFNLISKKDAVYVQSKLFKFVVICLKYGLHDIAVSLLERAIKESIIDKDIAFEIVNKIKKYDRRRQIIHFRWGSRIYGLIYKLEELFSIKKFYIGWADGDHILGNNYQKE